MNSWILPEESEIDIQIVNLDIDFKAYVKVDENGYIDPIIYESKIDFG